MSAKIQTLIDTKTAQLQEINQTRKVYDEHYGYLAAQAEQEIYDLNIQLQLEEANEQDKLPEGTKLKWLLDHCTYRVAIVTKKGVLQVKDVAAGIPYYHDWKSCACRPCLEIKLSSGKLPPWRRDQPFVKTFFATEDAWHESLPSCGKVTVTLPLPKSDEFNKLCLSPLTATTDPLKLKELEERFPEATFILNTARHTLEVSYIYYDVAAYPEEWNHQIYCKKTNTSFMRFKDFGRKAEDKPYLIAEWRGATINLSRFF